MYNRHCLQSNQIVKCKSHVMNISLCDPYMIYVGIINKEMKLPSGWFFVVEVLCILCYYGTTYVCVEDDIGISIVEASILILIPMLYLHKEE